MQHIVHYVDAERPIVAEALKGDYAQLCVHKYASNVVEKCLLYCEPEIVRLIIAELLTDEPLPETRPSYVPAEEPWEPPLPMYFSVRDKYGEKSLQCCSFHK